MGFELFDKELDQTESFSFKRRWLLQSKAPDLVSKSVQCSCCENFKLQLFEVFNNSRMKSMMKDHSILPPILFSRAAKFFGICQQKQLKLHVLQPRSEFFWNCDQKHCILFSRRVNFF
jgi:hypothetical protein